MFRDTRTRPARFPFFEQTETLVKFRDGEVRKLGDIRVQAGRKG